MKQVSIIIPTHNQLTLLRSCIHSIQRFTKEGQYEIIIIDNGSTDGTHEWLQSQPDLLLIRNNENLGYPKACNQGMKAAKGRHLLLLNDDTVVTPNWLDNLLTCLNSDLTIGAVGPVTNFASYHSAISVSYQNEEEMIQFARQYNVSDPAKWEERLKLVGFCLLIRGEAFRKTGLLDERFSPGNFEDDDYSLRLRQAGYRLILCRDTFIHHAGSASFSGDPNRFQQLLDQNEKKFAEKWGFSPHYSMGIREDLLDLMEHDTEDPIRVLDVGCACGGTLLKIKHLYPQAEVYGIELNPKAAAFASQLADVRQGDIEKMALDYPEHFFDYVLFADVLEHLYDPQKVLSRVLPHLKPTGLVLAAIPNAAYVEVVHGLLNGYWSYADKGILDFTHLRFFTLHEIRKMFAASGYASTQCIGFKFESFGEEMEQIIQKLASVSSPAMEEQYRTYRYLVKAAKTDRKVQFKHILRRIEQNVERHYNQRRLVKMYQSMAIDQRTIAEIIHLHMIDKEEVYNLVAQAFFEQQMLDVSLYLLLNAHRLNRRHEDTLYNLGCVYYLKKEYKKAAHYLKQLPPDEQVTALLSQMKPKDE